MTSPQELSIKSDLTHLVYTRAGNGTAQLYVNGNEVKPNDNNSSKYPGDFSKWVDSYKLLLANTGEAQPYQWLGEYHLVAIYNRALTKSEVARNFQAGLSKPATTEPSVLPPLNHFRHALKILYNQHRIYPEYLAPGENINGHAYLFNLKQNWKHLVVAEHHLIDVQTNDDFKNIEIPKTHQWTALQQVYWFKPNDFGDLLSRLQKAPIVSPAVEPTQIRVNQGYLHAGLQACLLQYLQNKDNNQRLNHWTASTLLIETSTPLWIRKTPIEQSSEPVALQYLPNGVQQASLSKWQDYYPSDPSDPKWLLLIMPFLGRLQPESEDKLELESIDPKEFNNIHPLQVDPILHLHYCRKLLPGSPIPTLTLALTHWADSTPLSVGVSGLDTILGRQWARLDALSLEESWFRIQNPPPDQQSSTFQSVLASFPETAARLSRDAALTRLFSSDRRFYPPQVDSPSAIASIREQLLVLQGVLTFDEANIPPYGWLLSGILILQGLMTAQTEDNQNHAAATVLPTPQKPHDQQLSPVPQSLAVSPYSRLQFQPLLDTPNPDQLRLVVVELLCLNAGDQLLRPVSSYTWESQKFILSDNQEIRNGDSFPNIKEQFDKNQIKTSGSYDITSILPGEKWKLIDNQTGFTCQIRKQDNQLIFYQDRPTIAQLATSWAEQSHQLLYPESPVAVLRFREIYEHNSSMEQTSFLVVRYGFSLVKVQDPVLAGKKVFALRSTPRQLRFREAQFNPSAIPNLETLNQFEIAPPYIAGVQPIYQKQPTLNNPGNWGLSTLRISVHYTKDQEAIAGSAINGSGSTLWWQGFQHLVQFRSAKTAGSTKAVAGLPPLFRAPAIKAFLPAASDLPLPTRDDLESTRQETNSPLTDWQPVLPGSIQYLLTGNRPGVIFAVRNQLIRQQLGQSGNGQSENNQPANEIVSGSVPVQHRMPRPLPLPDYQATEETKEGVKKKALQTWTSYFHPDKRLLATNTPVDEAFYADYIDQQGIMNAAKGLRIWLKSPELGVLKNDWDGSLLTWR